MEHIDSLQTDGHGIELKNHHYKLDALGDSIDSIRQGMEQVETDGNGIELKDHYLKQENHVSHLFGHKNYNYLHVPENDPEIDRAVDGEVPMVEEEPDDGTLQLVKIEPSGSSEDDVPNKDKLGKVLSAGDMGQVQLSHLKQKK